MQVLVKTPFHSQTGTLVVKMESPGECLVKELKGLIREKEPRMPERFSLRTLCGKCLDASKKVAEYDIEEAQNLYAVVIGLWKEPIEYNSGKSM